ncbi:aspartate aminotransferase family protein [Perlabentimonas gracilis]|uniref:aspartate aminotransferase family protein n=1 Tax=Perlabentimonas gracilis TaxID=2715279 RepID=UPI001409E830|nr:aspartate aminotransferase family protein [Perlabentimonas gracilis]NHB67181.1 aspartate aminotransferase family protein [Perlabentimonas gracilis]
MLTHRELFLKHIAQTSDAPLTLEVERAEGVYLYTSDNRKVCDLISGVSVSNVGHSHPEVVKAISQQAAKYMHLMVYGELVQAPQVKLAQAIVELLPSNFESVYFVNSGSEAVEGGVKLAKRYTGRPEIISMRNAYHGSTHGALSLMGNEGPKRSYRPLLPDVQHIDINCFEDLERITTKTACVIIEPIQGEAGIVASNIDYLVALRERCTSMGALLVFDEIQTGMGRTGKMFAFERYGVVPDILLLAKAFGGGMPLGAFISSKAIMECLTSNPPLGHITTFGGHPVSCAASLASINVLMENRLLDSIAAKANLFLEILSNHPKILSIRSYGLFMAVELGSFDKVQQVIKQGLEKGFLTDWFLFCDTAFRIAPPLTITDDEIRAVCRVILEVLDSL